MFTLISVTKSQYYDSDPFSINASLLPVSGHRQTAKFLQTADKLHSQSGNIRTIFFFFLNIRF